MQTKIYNPYTKQFEQRNDVDLFIEKYIALCHEYNMEFQTDKDGLSLWRVDDSEIDLGIIYIWFKDEVK